MASNPPVSRPTVPTAYGLRELYGGAMTVELPVDLIDSSDLRQIPNHQEVFLSPTTLTSIIFEINDYQTPQHYGGQPATSTTPTSTLSNPNSNLDGTGTTTTDSEAAKYHFTDVITGIDTLAAPLSSPQRVRLQKPSLASYPAYVLEGTIVSYDTRSPGGIPPLTSSQHQQQHQSSLVHQIQLLVRLQDHATDLCVRINVPLKEFANNNGDGDVQAAETETAFARDLLEHVVVTLDVVDFSLFGGGEA
ncbi:hypothetical protein ABEF93_003235 [Exophiala dermatitidis]